MFYKLKISGCFIGLTISVYLIRQLEGGGTFSVPADILLKIAVCLCRDRTAVFYGIEQSQYKSCYLHPIPLQSRLIYLTK